MTVSFIPVLPDPPVHHPTDYNPSIDWSNVKSLLVYKDEKQGRIRVCTCETDEEFQSKSLAATFNHDHTLIDSWKFE